MNFYENDFSKLKVLIIDDDENICKVITDFCKISNITSKYTTNPKEISELLKENFNVILLDQYLPGIKGLEIVKKGILDTENSYIILMTAGDLSSEMINTMLSLGVNEFLKKPFKLDVLKRIFFRAKTFLYEKDNFFKACQSIKKSEIELEIRNDLSIIGTVAKLIVRNVKELGFTDNLKIMETAIIEAISNSIIHGNLEIPSSIKDIGFEKFSEEIQNKLKDKKFKERKVYIYSFLSKEQFLVKIKDEGKGFNWRELNRKLKIDTFSLYGRGLFIIKTVFDDVKWNEKGNEITLIKYPKLSPSVKQHS